MVCHMMSWSGIISSDSNPTHNIRETIKVEKKKKSIKIELMVHLEDDLEGNS